MLIGLPDFAKERKLLKIVINWKFTKYLIFPICFCQRETFYIFTNLINSKLVSELVLSDETDFLCIMTNSDKQNILYARAQLQNPVNKAFNTKRNITLTSKETNWWSFNESLAGCLENIKL